MSDFIDSQFLIVDERIRVPMREITFTYARSSGAGGQNVNKVNSKAVLRWHPAASGALPEDARRRFFERYGSRLSEAGELIIMADEFRDQPRNRDACLKRLSELLLSIARAPKPRVKTKPTFGSKRRRLKAKKENSERKANRRKPGAD